MKAKHLHDDGICLEPNLAGYFMCGLYSIDTAYMLKQIHTTQRIKYNKIVIILLWVKKKIDGQYSNWIHLVLTSIFVALLILILMKIEQKKV